MKKILLIEDDLLSQRTTKLLLRKSYIVDVCGSANEFYADYSSNKYDLIIMDISLIGGKDGLELTREIKEMPNFINTPILCITAHALSADRINAYDAGVDFYLAKPVSTDVLFEKIGELVGG